MSSDVVPVDTNVLVYATYEDMEHHRASSHLLDQAPHGQLPLCASPQVLAELYATITNPRRVSHPFSPEEAIEVVQRFVGMPGLALLPMPSDLVTRWLALARGHPVTGRRIFDLQLIATMLASGVNRIYTYNRSDFEPFEEIEVLSP